MNGRASLHRAVVASLVALSSTPLGAQHVRTLESSRLLRDSSPVAVRLQLGTGTLSVGASDAPYLYRSITRFGDAYTAPTSTWNAAQRTLTLTAGQRSSTAPRRSDDDADDGTTQDWRVKLTRQAPLELTINASAADATLDLTGLPLRRFALTSGAAAATVRFDAPNPEMMSVFDANVGAGGLKLIGLGNSDASEVRIGGDVGDISLDLGGRWQRDMQIQVGSAIGTISITAPPTIGIELQSDGLLSRVSLDGDFSKDGKRWRSSNYASSAVKVRVLAKSILGRVTLIQR
ncbi:MAG TPA: hypothetical protein VE861_12335 [Gemmatimonadaceae bacterium]|nr:hypothetical protein [Gemmatimonadaceae bacterium]